MGCTNWYGAADLLHSDSNMVAGPGHLLMANSVITFEHSLAAFGLLS